MKRWCSGAWFMLLAAAAAAAAAAENSAVLHGPDPAVVTPGATAVCTVTVDAAGPGVALAPLPKVRDLTLEAEPPQVTVCQILVEGAAVWRESTSWRILLSPAAPGTYEVPPLLVRAGGRTSAVGPVRLHATAPVAPPEVAFVEVDAAADDVFLHQLLRLRLRFGVEERFLREGLVPFSGQRLDVPVQVHVAWNDLPGATADPAAAAAAGPAVSFALGDARGAAVPAGVATRAGRTFATFVLERTVLPTRSGVLAIPAPWLHFAFATRFTEDFFGARTPVDRQEAFVSGAPLAVTVRPLPEAGRPPDFCGAVGRLSVRGAAAPVRVLAGESVTFTLQIEGDGDLTACAPPSLADLPGFHLYGTLAERAPGRLTFRYDLAPLGSDVTAIPAVSLSWFDPAAGGYRTGSTAPIPLEVRPGAGDDVTPEPAAGARPAETLPASGGWVLPAILGGGLVVALAWLLVKLVRRGPRTPTTESVAPSGARGLDALLGGRLGGPPAALIDPELAERLVRAGIPADLAARVGAWYEETTAARYGGPPVPDAAARAALLAEELAAVAPRHARP